MKYFSLIDSLLSQNRVLKLAILSLTLTNLATAYLLYLSWGKQKIVVVPPEIRKEFWVAGNKVSMSYIEQVFYFLSDRILSVSPENVESSIATIYPFLSTDPGVLPLIEKQLYKYKKHVKENRIWQVFYPLSLKVEGNKVKVSGILKKGVEGQLISNENKTITFTFSVKNGRLIVEGIEL